ncbi:MAG: ribosome maturation factor RimM [Actinomycetota bacterium]
MGRIGKPHGVRGDVFVTFTSDVEQRHAVGSQLWLTDDASGEPLVVVASRAQKDRYVVHFKGCDDRDAAERLTNKYLYAPPVDDSSALWVHELIGSDVVDESGTRWGTCTGVVQNPAHDILEIDNSVLVPMPFVVSCDGETTVIRPPEGLREALSSD